MIYCSDLLGYKDKLLIQYIGINGLQYPTFCHMWVVFTLYKKPVNVILCFGCKLYHIPTYIPVELQIKYEHSNENLKCINKLSALIAVQHLYVALLSVLHSICIT